MVERIADGTFQSGDAVVFNGKPARFVSRTVKHREIEQEGKRIFVAAWRVTAAVQEKNAAAVALGRLGGLALSAAKRAAARANGAKGGRPPRAVA